MKDVFKFYDLRAKMNFQEFCWAFGEDSSKICAVIKNNGNSVGTRNLMNCFGFCGCKKFAVSYLSELECKLDCKLYPNATFFCWTFDCRLEEATDKLINISKNNPQSKIVVGCRTKRELEAIRNVNLIRSNVEPMIVFDFGMNRGGFTSAKFTFECLKMLKIDSAHFMAHCPYEGNVTDRVSFDRAVEIVGDYWLEFDTAVREMKDLGIKVLSKSFANTYVSLLAIYSNNMHWIADHARIGAGLIFGQSPAKFYGVPEIDKCEKISIGNSVKLDAIITHVKLDNQDPVGYYTTDENGKLQYPAKPKNFFVTAIGYSTYNQNPTRAEVLFNLNGECVKIEAPFVCAMNDMTIFEIPEDSVDYFRQFDIDDKFVNIVFDGNDGPVQRNHTFNLW